MTLRIGSLCAGYGGLDMGLSMVLDSDPVWFCEFAKGPSKILAHHYPQLPNHHDLTTTDWDAVDPVDIVTAGWPYQPWSLAGARKGAEDERAIWPAVADAIRRLRPQYVALENVSAIVGLGELARAVGDLAALGYDAQWQCVRASDVGAPHKRERCFILACYSERPRLQGSAGSELLGAEVTAATSSRTFSDTWSGGGREEDSGRRGLVGEVCVQVGREESSGAPRPDRTLVADASGARLGKLPAGASAEEAGARSCDEPAGDRRSRAATDWGPYRPAIERWERATGRPAPRPTEPSRNGNERLSPLLVEWMMGLPEGWVTAVPDLSRNEQLKALGNGVVPQQAGLAYGSMLPALAAAS